MAPNFVYFFFTFQYDFFTFRFTFPNSEKKSTNFFLRVLVSHMGNDGALVVDTSQIEKAKKKPLFSRFRVSEKITSSDFTSL